MIDSAWTKYFGDETDGVIIDIKSDTLDLKSIADSGQCFRWYVQDDGSVAFLFEGCAVLGYTLKNGIVRLVAIEKSMTCNQIYEKVLNYLDFKTDYRAVINGIDKKDNHLINAAKYSEGIRILNAPAWETTISFIISQNNNIPRIKKSVILLSERFGKKLTDVPRLVSEDALPCLLEGRKKGKGAENSSKEAKGKSAWPEALSYTFPNVYEIDENNLEDLGLGYRDKYIEELVSAIKQGDEDIISVLENSRISFADKKEKLLSIKGIGEKVANCIMLFAVHDVKAFPRDTWVKKIEEKYYNGCFPCEKYPESAGIMQQYLFFYEREAGK